MRKEKLLSCRLMFTLWLGLSFLQQTSKLLNSLSVVFPRGILGLGKTNFDNRWPSNTCMVKTKCKNTAISDIKNEDIKNCPSRNITQESDVMPEINNKEDSLKKCQPRKNVTQENHIKFKMKSRNITMPEVDEEDIFKFENNAEQSSVLLPSTIVNQDSHPSSIDIDLIDGRYRDKKEKENNSIPTLIQSFDTSVVKINKEIISPPQHKMATSLQSTTITEGWQHNIKKRKLTSESSLRPHKSNTDQQRYAAGDLKHLLNDRTDYAMPRPT
ncbi:hypothetical protein CBL_04191 [Carabus blaptoides fortunei]